MHTPPLSLSPQPADFPGHLHAPLVSDADWTDVRRHTVAAHEMPTFFVAETAEDGEDHEEFTDSHGVPVSAYATPLSLWEMKSGLYTPVSGPRSIWSRIKYGVIDAVADEQGWETRRPAGVYLHPDLPILSGRLDREISEDGGTSWVPVISFSVTGDMADTWRNAIGDWVVPTHIDIQAQSHMAILGAPRLYVIAFIGGRDIKLFEVERDEDIIDGVMQTAAAFWERVTSGVHPAPQGPKDDAVIARLYARVTPDAPVIDLRNDPDAVRLYHRKKTLLAEKKPIEDEIRSISSALKAKVRNAKSGVITDTHQLTWQTTPARTQHVSESTRLTERKITDRSSGATLEDLAELDAVRDAARTPEDA